MLKLNQFRIEGTIPSSDTTTYRAIDKATGSTLLLHFFPQADEARFQLHARLQLYVETCRTRGVPIKLSIEETEGFVASGMIEDFGGLGAWLDSEIATVRGAAQQPVPEERTLDVTWLRYADAKYDRPVSTASEFGFFTLPPKPGPEPEPDPTPEPQHPVPPTPPAPQVDEVEQLRAQLQHYRRLTIALAIALGLSLLTLFAVIAAGNSR
jgi:hypothetical protein